jgi:thiol-disulfide isomerase/thioredoxin
MKATLPNSSWHKIIFVQALVLLLSLSGYNSASAQYTPDFSLGMKEFKQKALEAKDEVWVVDFWASWCGPCIQSVPHVKELQAKYAEKNVRFISISWDKDEPKWQAALLKLQMPWQHLRAERPDFAWLDKYFKHSGIPTAFVISRNGKSKKVNDPEALEGAIEKALEK